MTALPNIALAFARECMGWKVELSHGSVTRNSEGCLQHFRFNDLNVVIEAVQGFCAINDHIFVLSSIGRGGRYVGATISKCTSITSGVESDNPCLALMSACVEAARRIKEGA